MNKYLSWKSDLMIDVKTREKTSKYVKVVTLRRNTKINHQKILKYGDKW
jgi:hypothetical protein